MEHFVDREEEMETLENEYERKGSALVVLYGRRRVGKTTLISEFIKDKKALFFLASEESESQNRNAFREKVAEFIDSDLLRSSDVKSWDVLFKSIIDTPFDSKPVIVLDEFQYLGSGESQSRQCSCRCIFRTGFQTEKEKSIILLSENYAQH